MAEQTPAELQAQLADMRKQQAGVTLALAEATRPVIAEAQALLDELAARLPRLRELRALMGGGSEPNSPGAALYMGVEHVDSIITNVHATTHTALDRLDRDIQTATAILAS